MCGRVWSCVCVCVCVCGRVCVWSCVCVVVSVWSCNHRTRWVCGSYSYLSYMSRPEMCNGRTPSHSWWEPPPGQTARPSNRDRIIAAPSRSLDTSPYAGGYCCWSREPARTQHIKSLPATMSIAASRCFPLSALWSSSCQTGSRWPLPSRHCSSHRGRCGCACGVDSARPRPRDAGRAS